MRGHAAAVAKALDDAKAWVKGITLTAIDGTCRNSAAVLFPTLALTRRDLHPGQSLTQPSSVWVTTVCFRPPWRASVHGTSIGACG